MLFFGEIEVRRVKFGALSYLLARILMLPPNCSTEKNRMTLAVNKSTPSSLQSAFKPVY